MLPFTSDYQVVTQSLLIIFLFCNSKITIFSTILALQILGDYLSQRGYFKETISIRRFFFLLEEASKFAQLIRLLKSFNHHKKKCIRFLNGRFNKDKNPFLQKKILGCLLMDVEEVHIGKANEY